MSSTLLSPRNRQIMEKVMRWPASAFLPIYPPRIPHSQLNSLQFPLLFHNYSLSISPVLQYYSAYSLFFLFSLSEFSPLFLCLPISALFSPLYPFLWSPYVIGQTIIVLPCDFYLLSFFFLFFLA